MPGIWVSPMRWLATSLPLREAHRKKRSGVGYVLDLHPSTSSSTTGGIVHSIAFSEVCISSTSHRESLQRASRARWSESSFQPKT